MTRRRLLLLFPVLALTVAAGLWGWRSRAPEVQAVQLTPGPLLRSLQFSARVATAARVELGSTVTGRVVEVLAQEGRSVRRGELLLRLETDELQAALAQARASERQAQARLIGLRGSGRSAAQATVAQAESVLRAAQAELMRSRELIAQGFLSPSRLDEAQRAEAVARAQLDAARAQAGALDEAGSDVAQAQAQLTQAQAAALTAQAKLAQTQLRAPADAQVLDRLAEPGQIVQPGKALLVLALHSPLELVAQVDERYLEQLAAGQNAAVVADAYPERRFAAKLLRIAPLVDAQRGAVEVRLAPQPPLPDFLREDMTLSVEVETARRDRVLWLPIEALRVHNPATPHAATSERATVWRLAEGRVEAREIRVGLRTLAAVEVTEGLAAGDVVLVGASPSPGSRARAVIRTAETLLQSPKSGSAGDAGSALTSAMGR